MSARGDYSRICNRCGKHAPESWSSGFCNECYRQVGEENERARHEAEDARWDAIKTRAEAAESRVADLEAGIRALADEAKPGLSKMCTCPDCEDDESPIWHDGTPIAWTLDPASLRALVGDDTTRSEATR